MKIVSVIVTYNPDPFKLRRLCRTLTNAGTSVIIVDNTENSTIDHEEHELISVIPLKTNTGIAHAQNTGIRNAFQIGAEIIVFFDQDSEISTEFLGNLLDPLRSGDNLVTSPVFFDKNTLKESPSYRINKLGLPVKVFSGGKPQNFPTDIIISSGTAVPVKVLKHTGLMDEDFFIDYVDIEWCFRCREKGIRIIAVPGAVMYHSIGEMITGRNKALRNAHNPVRNYYQVRNCFMLFRKKHIPFLFALREIISVFIHKFVLLFYVTDKGEYLRSYIIAIAHGIRGIKGKKPDSN